MSALMILPLSVIVKHKIKDFGNFVIMHKMECVVMYELIESLCRERDITITQMCREAEVPRGNLTDLKMGRQSGLSAKNLQKIANYFNVSVSYLLGGEKEKPVPETGNELSDVQREAMELIMQLSDEQLKVFVASMKAMMGK